MRTKTLLLTAALSAATIASAFAADSVYSVNVVGYATKQVGNPAKATTPHWALESCPLMQMQSSLVKDLIPNPPPGTILYKFDGTGFVTETFDPDDLVWVPGTASLAFGEGFWVYSTPFTITWVGQVAEGVTAADSNMSLRHGWNLVGAKVPQHTPLAPVYTNVTPGNIVYKYDVTNGIFITATFDPDDLIWTPDPNGLELNIGDGLWVYELGASGGSWNRNFTVPRN